MMNHNIFLLVWVSKKIAGELKFRPRPGGKQNLGHNKEINRSQHPASPGSVQENESPRRLAAHDLPIRP
jgi:hypothetical protein